MGIDSRLADFESGFMLRWLITTFVTALAVPFYLKWARAQSEGQIDKMQRGVHGTPGVEAPVPPPVMLAGVGALALQWVAARLLGLRSIMALLSLAIGVVAGLGFYLFGTSGGQR